MKDLIISGIESLPPLSATLMKLRDACSKEEVSLKEVASIIETDPFLMANIIKFANSPLYGASRQVTTILQATTMFGVKTIKGLAIASAIKAQFEVDLQPYGIKTCDFVNTANLKSSFILEWYNKKRDLLDILVPLAFLMHIGMVLIARVIKEFHTDLQMLNFMELQALEKEAVSFNQLEVLGLLFEHWAFETTMLDVIQELNNISTNKDFIADFFLPLKAINLLIDPYKSATKEQIDNTRIFISNNNLDLEAFDNTLLKLGLIENLDSLEQSY